MVAITLALSCTAYSLADFHVDPVPVYSVRSYSAYGAPSFLHIAVNSSAPTNPAEFRLDGASSLSGFLALASSGYSVAKGLCVPGETTFFSVAAGPGTISVSGASASYIDGVETSVAAVQGGWHEVVLVNGSGCVVELPGGTRVSGSSPELSTVPFMSSSSRSFLILVPYDSGGHTASLVFDGGTQVVDF